MLPDFDGEIYREIYRPGVPLFCSQSYNLVLSLALGRQQAELHLHAEQVRHYIVLHDIETFAFGRNSRAWWYLAAGRGVPEIASGMAFTEPLRP